MPSAKAWNAALLCGLPKGLPWLSTGVGVKEELGRSGLGPEWERSQEGSGEGRAGVSGDGEGPMGQQHKRKGTWGPCQWQQGGGLRCPWWQDMVKDMVGRGGPPAPRLALTIASPISDLNSFKWAIPPDHSGAA